MAYVAPSTRADGYVVPAAVWNSDVVENPIALKALINAIRPQPCGRLTLTTALPVTTADVTAATTLYYALYKGNQIALYDGSSAWVLSTIAELSIAVPATTSTMYDVFVDYNAGTPVLAVTAWTNDTTRATALTTQNGVLVQTGNTDWLYVGSFRTTTVSGETEDSLTKRFVWNYYNRVPRALRRLESTASWGYTLAVFRQANAAAANQVDVVVGLAEATLSLSVLGSVRNSTGGVNTAVSIGEDSTTAAVAGVLMHVSGTPTAAAYFCLTATINKMPAIGRHYYAWLEYSGATGTTTWGGTLSAVFVQSGMSGFIEG